MHILGLGNFVLKNCKKLLIFWNNFDDLVKALQTLFTNKRFMLKLMLYEMKNEKNSGRTLGFFFWGGEVRRILLQILKKLRKSKFLLYARQIFGGATAPQPPH